jgi:GT2 family glycosyltransferase
MEELKNNPSTAGLLAQVGVVAIGRNEGQRLISCINSVTKGSEFVVYVDSGSTDGSALAAKNAHAQVVELDMKTPFSAARARNAGFEYLRQLAPSLSFVQFVDGDCEVDKGWIKTAVGFLNANREVAVVCGRRRERFPSRSIYNRLCDAEWNTPIGKTKACGGDAMMRVDAFERIGGFREDLIAGEEPELCVRLRAAGWQIWRLDSEMTLHDANITQLRQWGRRNVRSGYAFAAGANLHGAPPERHWVWESRRALFWGALLPLFCVLASTVFPPFGLTLWFIYPVQMLRRMARLPGSTLARAQTAFFELLGRFPEAFGQIKFIYDRFLRRQGRLIEYK